MYLNILYNYLRSRYNFSNLGNIFGNFGLLNLLKLCSNRKDMLNNFERLYNMNNLLCMNYMILMKGNNLNCIGCNYQALNILHNFVLGICSLRIHHSRHNNQNYIWDIGYFGIWYSLGDRVSIYMLKGWFHSRRGIGNIFVKYIRYIVADNRNTKVSIILIGLE